MSGFPQLRVRTEYSFRQAFGPVAEVAAVLAELGTPVAAMVDPGTWGHVRWATALKKAGVRPAFGVEVVVPQDDGRKPVAWAIAEDTRGFYTFSTACRAEGADVENLFREARGVIRFAGAALNDPECFDYVDLNPASPLRNRSSLALSRRTGRPLVITSDNAYPRAGDYSAFMACVARDKTTPQHVLGLDELRAQFRFLDDAEWTAAVRATHEAAERSASSLPTAPLIKVPGELREVVERGRLERLRLGHIADWTEAYAARLERELALIEAKNFASYFLVVSDLISWAKQRMFVGPGRGSAAGSLVCYLMRITEVDPLAHDLLFERFIDITRDDLPDIDIDFADTKRDLVFDYLVEKYGRANVARVGSVNTLKAKSVLAEVCRRFAIPDRDRFDVANVLIEHAAGDARFNKSIEDTFQQTEAGRHFAKKFPEAAIMFRIEGHAWHTGVHAGGVLVCNEPVSSFCTVRADGVAEIDKRDAETLNLLKIDALGLRTLGVLEDSGVVDNETLYALTLDDPEVFGILNAGKYSGVFQFEGQAMRGVASDLTITSFRQIDHLTALARPGPLGGGATSKYIRRANGDEEVTFKHPALEPILGRSLGVILYQEQVMQIAREIGRFSWEDTTKVRKQVSKSQGREAMAKWEDQFVAGAATIGMSEADARELWGEIISFGAYGMNASHTVSYSVVSYWCAWMKRYHPLEYAAAALRNAKDNEQATGLLRELHREGVTYTPFDMERSEVNWSVKDGRLLGGFMNLDGFGPSKSVQAVEARRLGMVTDRMRERIAKARNKFGDLFPLHSQFGDLYRDPEAFGCMPGSTITELARMPDSGDVLTVIQVNGKEIRDENEAKRVARRNGKMIPGQSLFLDIHAIDDSSVPFVVRINRFQFERLGRRAAEVLVNGDVLLIRGRKVPGFNMLMVERIKCLTNPTAFAAIE